MGIAETKTPQHWNYFLALEEDVNRLSRYLEPTKANFTAYSLELARILFAAASEVDVVAKQLCQRLNAESRADNINRYKQEILAVYPQLVASEVSLPKFGLALTPWEQWGKDRNPIWWKAYNEVKHQRHTHFPSANLKNALNAVAALFALLLFFYDAEAAQGRLTPDPSLFRMGAPFHVDQLFYAPHSTVYLRLPNTEG